MRFFRTRQRGEWWTVAAVTASGGDERARVCCGERTEEGEEREGVRRGLRRLRGVVLGVEAAAGSRRWPDAWPARDEHAPSVLVALG